MKVWVKKICKIKVSPGNQTHHLLFFHLILPLQNVIVFPRIQLTETKSIKLPGSLFMSFPWQCLTSSRNVLLFKIIFHSFAFQFYYAQLQILRGQCAFSNSFNQGTIWFHAIPCDCMHGNGMKLSNGIMWFYAWHCIESHVAKDPGEHYCPFLTI